MRVLASKPAVFILASWLTARIIVFAGFLRAPHPNVGMIENWDGAYYHAIAINGYEYANDGNYHSIAFFPLYPLIVAIFVRLGAAYDYAAIVVNNACFSAMLFVIYDWVAGRNGTQAARWSVAVLAFFPMSLFGSVGYSEGTFMFLTALTLRDFDRGRYGWATLWSGFAALARPTGIFLLPALGAATVLEHRPRRAFLPAFAAVVGLLTVVTYSARQFHDPFAFVHAQRVWRHESFADAMREWGVLLAGGSISHEHWAIQLSAAVVVAFLCFLDSKIPVAGKAILWPAIVGVEHFCWATHFPFAVIGLLAFCAMLSFRRELGAATTAYGLIAVAGLLCSGGPLSVSRLLYGVLACGLAVALVFVRVPYFGAGVLAVFTLELYYYSASFAEKYWVD